MIQIQGLIHVLYVEDDESVAIVTKELFEKTEEFSLTIAPSSEKAIEVASKSQFDVIISDYLMPKMNGIELLGILKSGPLRNIPFILFTGKIKEMAVNEAVRNEIFYYVPKGDSFDELIYAAKDAAARKKSIDSPIDALKKLQLLNSTTLHDWRNIDTAILNYIELIESNVNDPNMIKNFCEKINDAAEKNTRLRAESKIFHQISSENKWYLLKNMISGLNDNYPQWSFFNEIPEDIEIFADIAVFKAIISVFLDNSQRHGQRVSEIHFSFDKNDKHVRFSYRDNGVGIVSGNKEKIFIRGFGNNTGFGLFLAKELIQLAGGDVVETGTFGQGACFEIIVPFYLYRYRLRQ